MDGISGVAGHAERQAAAPGLPMAALLALTMCSFIATANETVAAGLLPQIARGFGVSQGWAGQWVTACALGSGLAAMPLTLALRGWRRRLVLLLAVAGFIVGNAVTAVSPSFGLALAARLLAGVATGLAWSLLAGYARRMAPASLQGRSMALAMVGIPLALAFGVPLSAWLGELAGWRAVFGALSGLSLALAAWVLRAVPDYPGQAARRRLPLKRVWMTPGVRPVLGVILLWILAHYTLYTYIAPFMASRGLGARVDAALLVFGVAALGGIWFTGLWVDRGLRALVLASLGGFALVALALGSGWAQGAAVYVAIALWGASFGGAPTLLQTALADAAGEGAEVAQSMLVTVFNLAFAAGGALGGVLLETAGAQALPRGILVLLALAIAVAWRARVHGFKSGRRRAAR
ncbi:Purine ribonucleoside efflux pump nepI [Achromobacter sp. 2789STDY5608615]|uniref:MFS transporter n=1 Tax=Achromobacter sp. 2789STDY5608615 TaxID=1806492 RepID=UPI0006C2E349|nr:MFS transporter [Achromobacter sp. 2789STDY5608615]CUK08117.1 Purine ribonucleoside efflux pump nepI [Achromobacter sp. 2789STDY5608615]